MWQICQGLSFWILFLQDNNNQFQTNNEEDFNETYLFVFAGGAIYSQRIRADGSNRCHAFWRCERERDKQTHSLCLHLCERHQQRDGCRRFEALEGVPGIRIDRHNSGEEYASDRQVFNQDFPATEFNSTSVNPRVAVKYNAGEHLTLRANVGTGLRAPYGFSEDLHLCSGSPRVWKSSELKAETSHSANLSDDYYGHHFQVRANLFYTYLKDKIDFTDAYDNVKNLGYTCQWRNIDDAAFLYAPVYGALYYVGISINMSH